jgi:hypothetical protein
MTTSVEAVVRDLGRQYADGFRQLEIQVPVERAEGLPYRIGARVPITLSVGGADYKAGVRSTNRCPVVWICPDVIDHLDRRTTLGRVLSRNGLGPNSRVLLSITGRTIQLLPALAHEEL